jgi:mono/diheme cytochrome c family protein
MSRLHAVRGLMRMALWAGGAAVVGFAILIAIELIAGDADSVWAQGSFSSQTVDKSSVERGRYLSIVGNCAACHTARGGEPYAGGKAIQTPFGEVYASNITPDATHGIGRWSSQAFYRAMHEGISADGRLLTPAFPYPNMTHVSREDSDALHAYFMHGVQPVAQPNREHALRFPFNTQVALAAWRVLFFERGEPQATLNKAPEAATARADGGDVKIQRDQLLRGEYLIKGLAHCSACHAERNAFGATTRSGLLSGALMPMQDWYAPSLHSAQEAGLQSWKREHVVQLLQSGVSPHASVAGPMVEVVAKSTQYWREDDLQAAAAYLQSLPESPPVARPVQTINRSLFDKGAALYTQHCATCHGDDGQGVRLREGNTTIAIPPLAGNRAITMPVTANLVRIILAGGYAPSTQKNPRPYGMPPFVHVLTDDEIAAVASYIRNAWGNEAASGGDTLAGHEVVVQRRGLLQ